MPWLVICGSAAHSFKSWARSVVFTVCNCGVFSLVHSLQGLAKLGFPLICCNTLTSSKAGHAQSRNCRCSIMRKTWHCSDFCSAFFAHCHLSWRWSQAWKLLLAPTCEHLYDLVRLFGLGTYIQDYTSFLLCILNIYIYILYIQYNNTRIYIYICIHFYCVDVYYVYYM